VSTTAILIQQIINGISLGSIYALIAIGYTMVYGIVKLINFAHGDLLMVGAYAAYFMLRWVGPSPSGYVAAFLFAMAVCMVFGVTIERFAYRPLRSAPRINALITAIGISLLLENGARVIPFIGPNPREFQTMKAYNFPVFGASISSNQIVVLLVAVGLMFVLTFIVGYTKMGKAMRAVSFDMRAASLMGIPVNSVISFTFAIGSALAAAAGVLFAIAYPQVVPTMGIMPGLKAFIAAVLGGIGSIPGAMLGGYVLGVAETLTKGFVSSKLADAVVFGILIVILLVKPTGIIASRLREKV
jgi:branched-chain amino acid transport system permease protein